MAQKKHGRRAADTRVKTPLTELTEALGANSGAVGRRAAVVAAAGGLVLTAGIPAVGQSDKTEDQGVVTAEAQAPDTVEYAAQSATTIVAADESADKLAAVAATSVAKATAAPEPEPEPEATTTSDRSDRGTGTSRSNERSEGSGSSSSSSEDSSGSSEDSSGSSEAEVSVPDGSTADKVISIASQYVGVPYVLGGTSPSGWDCSGYIQYVYGKAGVSLPRTSGAQKAAGTVVSASEARPGDLVWRPGHIGIYAGDGMMYDAGSPRSDTSYRSHSWMGSVTYIRVL